MTQKITFTKSGETNATQKLNGKELNAKGIKLGWKEIDDWLANPQTDHESDFIYRVKIEPFELSLNGEKRRTEIIDFFVNADTRLYFYLENALKDNNNFELQWIAEQVGKCIGFSENRPNVLIAYSNGLDIGGDKKEREKIRQNWDIRDLEIDWENINLLEWGFSFDLISPLSISLDNRNFTYDKVFLSLDYPHDEYELLKKRLTEWKKNKKQAVIKNAVLSAKSWLSVRDSNVLYIVNGEIKELNEEWFDEAIFKRKFNNWDKLPYQRKRNFVERHFERKKSYESMKNEIEAAIRALENGENGPGKPPEPIPSQNNPAKNASPNQFPWKIIIPVVLCFLVVIALGVIIKKKKKKSRRSIKTNSEDDSDG